MKCLVLCVLFIQQLFVFIHSQDTKNDIIYITDKSMQTVRLKSVLGVLNQTNGGGSSNSQKLFWSFKRIYFIPNLRVESSRSFYVKSSFELAQNELMISLDSEVQDNLKEKYSIGVSEDAIDRFDLVINNLTYADSGLYKCNLWNQKTIYYRLTVTSSISKPEINIEYASPKNNLIPDNMFMESSNLLLKCTSRHAYPYPTIKWFRNNVELLPSENRINYKLVDKETNTIESTLSLKNLTYSLNMNNITCKLVQIQQADTSSEQSSDVESNSSTATSDLTSEQQLWQTSDPILLNIAFKPVISVDVIKTNESVSSLSELVSYQTITLNQTSSKIYLYESDAGVLFHCKHKSNPNDQINIVWLINGVAQNQTDFADHDVFVWRANKFNSKEIKLTCEIENRVGLSSFTIDIVILYEPKIRLDRSHYEVDEFSQVQLNCLVDASPLPVLTEWRLSNQSQSATTSNKLATNSTVLEFKSIKHTENAGVYVCHSENLMNDSFGDARRGLAEFTVDIEVRFKPQMNTVYKKLAAISLDDNVSLENGTISQNISCMTMANPAPVFNWFKNGMKIPTSSIKYSISQVRSKSKNLYESVLVIHDLNENDDLNQKYVCETSNTLGSSQIEIELVAKSRPDQPTEIRTLRVDFMTINLAWSAGFDGGLTQTFALKLNDTMIDLNPQANNSVLTVRDRDSRFRIIKYSPSLINITNLNPDTVYSLSLSAKNSLGNSDWSEPVVVKTRPIDQSQVSALAEFDTMFLNVPKNRLEFTFKQPEMLSSETINSESNSSTHLPSISSLIPVCLNISVTLYRPTSNNQNKFSFVKCLSLNDSYTSQRVLQFDLMPQQDVLMVSSESHDDQERFNAKQIKSMRVSVCFELNNSVCTKPISAIIDTYNKLSHSSLLLNKKTGDKNGNTPDDYFNTDYESTENSLFDKLGLSSKLKSLMSPHTISTTLIVSIGVCIATLIIILFGMIICCMRKHNFKMCKHVLSQANAGIMNDNCCGKQNSDFLSTGSPDQNNKFTKEIIAVSKPNDGRPIQAIANKAFDVGCMISAPMTNQSYNTNTMLSLNGVNQYGCGGNLGNLELGNCGNTLPKQGQSSKKRTFTAALTATATNIISNSIGKHKINEILVTEDDEQQSRFYKSLGSGMKPFNTSEFNCAEMILDETDMTRLDPPMLTIHNATSSHTPSTAVSNCSSSSNNNNMVMGYHGNMMIMYDEHNNKLNPNQHTTVGLTLMEGFNSGGGSSSSSTSSCANSASNSDPVAINNSLSSTNSATESPTYGYNVASGATLNLQHQLNGGDANQMQDHVVDNFFYIKANLSVNQTQDETNLMEEGESYVKATTTTTSGLGHRANIRNSMRSSSNPNNSNNMSSLSTSMANHTINGGYMDPPESGYSTPSRHKKVVYEVIV